MAYKSRPVETTVAAAVGDAFAEFTALGEEMREWADNMPESKQSSSKHDEVEAAADELESHDSEPDVPEFLQELKVTTTEQVNKNKRRGPSRDVRLSNAQALLSAARDVVQEWIDEKQKDDPDGKEAEGQIEEAESFINDLDEHVEFSVDFPGMYG